MIDKQDERLPPPDHLDEVASGEWIQLTASLADLDLLSGTDRASLEIYCQTYSAWRNAVDMVSRHGAVISVKTGSGTFLRRNPFDIIREKNAQLCARLLKDFGLTPTSKAREVSESIAGESLEEKRERILRRFIS